MSQDQNQHPEGLQQSANDIPETTEVVPKAKRRRFSAAYKLRILREYEACHEPGQKGALLRREGLYSSNLVTWRRQREQGGLSGLASKKRGRKADPQVAEIARLERENERLRTRLHQAELIIEVQKKVSQILALESNGQEETR
jgi:transposase